MKQVLSAFTPLAIITVPIVEGTRWTDTQLAAKFIADTVGVEYITVRPGDYVHQL